jgi:hypothetical protein
VRKRKTQKGTKTESWHEALAMSVHENLGRLPNSPENRDSAKNEFLFVTGTNLQKEMTAAV